MKKFGIFFMVILIGLTPRKAQGQEKGETVAAAVGALAMIGAGIAAMEQLKEEFELFATDYILDEYDYKAFELKINGLGEKSKTFDPSSVSVISFNITPVDYEYGSKINNEKIALLVFLDSGWRNEFGIDITKVKFAPFNIDSWNSLISKYISLASGIDIVDNKVPIFEKNGTGNIKLKVGDTEYSKKEGSVHIKYIDIEKSGIKNRDQIILPFKKISGDTYFVSDFSDEYKIIYNEKSLGLYLKEVERLVQLKVTLVREITDFLNQN